MAGRLHDIGMRRTADVARQQCAMQYEQPGMAYRPHQSRRPDITQDAVSGARRTGYQMRHEWRPEAVEVKSVSQTSKISSDVAYKCGSADLRTQRQ